MRTKKQVTEEYNSLDDTIYWKTQIDKTIHMLELKEKQEVLAEYREHRDKALVCLKLAQKHLDNLGACLALAIVELEN